MHSGWSLKQTPAIFIRNGGKSGHHYTEGTVVAVREGGQEVLLQVKGHRSQGQEAQFCQYLHFELVPSKIVRDSVSGLFCFVCLKSTPVGSVVAQSTPGSCDVKHALSH